MKIVALLIPLLFFSGLLHASSKYAGEYYLVSQSYGPFRKGPTLTGGANVTVAEDGSLTGRGIFIDLKPITLSGEIKDSGEVVLYESADRTGTKLMGNYYPARKEFAFYYPGGLAITGRKIPLDFPQAGIYHAKAGFAKDILLFINRDGSVHGVVHDGDDHFTVLDGSATAAGFRASSGDGIGAIACSGTFDQDKIKGGYFIGDLATVLTGAKY